MRTTKRSWLAGMIQISVLAGAGALMGCQAPLTPVGDDLSAAGRRERHLEDGSRKFQPGFRNHH